MRGLNAISHVDHFSLVNLGHGEQAELVASASLPGEHATPMAQNAYIERYHHIDPNRKVLQARPAQQSSQLGKSCMIARLERDQIKDHGYRQTCYIRPGLLDRYSIVVRDSARLHCLNLYRFKTSGHFRNHELKQLGRFAPILAALTAKQSMLVGTGGVKARVDQTREQVAQRLRALQIGLSKREIEVTTGILCGLTSEAIALDLGISLNTVLTYRKRAYAKAGVSSQNALFARCLGSAFH